MFDTNLNDDTVPLLSEQATSSYIYETNTKNNIELSTFQLQNHETTLLDNYNTLATTTFHTKNNDNNAKLKISSSKISNNNYGSINQNSAVVTEQPILNNSDKNSNNKSNVITCQPKKTASDQVSDYTISGIFKNNIWTPCFQKNIAFIDLSKDHVAFDQKVSCCYLYLSYNKCESCEVSTLLPAHYLTLINMGNSATNFIDYNTVKDNFIKKNNIPVKEISFNKQNNNFIILYDDKQADKSNSELYLIQHIQASEESTPLKNIKFDDGFKIECPLEKIYSIYYDNEVLYAVGRKYNKLILMITTVKIDQNKDICRWKEVTTLSYNDIKSNATFSSNGEFIFILAKNNQLLIFSKEDGWNEINRLSNKNSFPIDINYNSEDMVFINDNNMLTINKLKSTNRINLLTLTNVTAVCFIPNSTSFIVFTAREWEAEFKMYLIKKKLNKYVIISEQYIGYSIEKAYFHPQDSNKLIALAKMSPRIGCVIDLASITGIPLTAYTAWLTTCCFCWKDWYDCSCMTHCCSAARCSKYKVNSLIGTYVGSGISAALCLTFFIISALHKNSIQTNLSKIK